MIPEPRASVFAGLVDGVLIINLDDRADRWEQTKSALAGLIPPDKQHRISAIRGTNLAGFGQPPWFRGRRRDRTWAGRAGVLLSHRKAIATARKRAWRSVLILEDDVEFDATAGTIMESLATALARQPWDICYLGFTDPKAPFECVADLDAERALWAVSGCNTAHAYLLRDSTFDWLLERLPKQEAIWDWLSQHRAIDRWYYRNLSRCFNVLAVSPAIVNQRPAMSDITQRMNDGNHVTEVDTARAVKTGFAWRNSLRHLGWRMAEPRDWLRGKLKALRGF